MFTRTPWRTSFSTRSHSLSQSSILHPPTHISRIVPHRPFNRPFQPHRTTFTTEQIKTAELQKTPHTPLQIVAEIPHSNAPAAIEEIIDVPSPLWYHRLGKISKFFSWFSRMQRRRPLTVTLVTSLTTYFWGDYFAQRIGGEPYDFGRTVRMLCIGSISSIPGYKWFLFLGSHWNYESKLLSIAIKVAIQQCVFAPIFNTYFFGMQAILAGNPPSVVLHRIAEAVPQSVLSSIKFWPVVTAINFTFIPPAFRFMFSGFFAVIWQTYLSFLNRRTEIEGPTKSLVEEGLQQIFEESVSISEEDTDEIEDEGNNEDVTDRVEAATTKIVSTAPAQETAEDTGKVQTIDSDKQVVQTATGQPRSGGEKAEVSVLRQPAEEPADAQGATSVQTSKDQDKSQDKISDDIDKTPLTQKAKQ